MISIQRTETPDILKNAKEKWTQKFLESGKSRPSSNQYAHEQIKNELSSMSHGKCFYCETKLGVGKDGKAEVDHFVEVSKKPELAFEWNNLYLSCSGCNQKKKYSKIPINEFLDPCKKGVDPAEHITFDDELIRPRNGSAKGSNTIKKFGLDREELDYLRAKQIIRFYEFLEKIRRKQIKNGRSELNDNEIEVLKSFKQPDHAYSLMFSLLLNNLDI